MQVKFIYQNSGVDIDVVDVNIEVFRIYRWVMEKKESRMELRRALSVVLRVLIEEC